MGLDISFGICYGIDVYSSIDRKTKLSTKNGLFDELGRQITYITRYNEKTGEPYQRQDFDWMLEFNYDFMKWKKGDIISDDDWKRYLYNDLYEEFNSSNRELITNSQCIGFKAFIGEEPYESPQDISMELVLDIENAKKKWEANFPNIPGTLLMYLHASY